MQSKILLKWRHIAIIDNFSGNRKNNKKKFQVCFEKLEFRQFETGDYFLFILSKHQNFRFENLYIKLITKQILI